MNELEDKQPSDLQTDWSLAKNRLTHSDSFHKNLLLKPELIAQLLGQPNTVLQRAEQRLFVRFILENSDGLGQNQLVDQLKKDLLQAEPTLLVKNLVRESRRRPDIGQTVQKLLEEAKSSILPQELSTRTTSLVSVIEGAGTTATGSSIENPSQSALTVQQQESVSAAIPRYQGMDIAQYRDQLEQSLTSASELERSIRSFVLLIMDTYLHTNHLGTVIHELRLDYNNLVIGTNHQTIEMALPEGTSILKLITRGASGPGDNRLWESTIIVSEVDEGNKKITADRLDRQIAGQKTDGTWQRIGRFEDLLKETPKERVLHQIEKMWQTPEAPEKEKAAEIAAELLLSHCSIDVGTADDLDQNVLNAIRTLENVAREQHVDVLTNPTAYQALPEFHEATDTVSRYLQEQRQGVLSATEYLINRQGTVVRPYELEEDPIAKFKAAENFKQIIQIDFADVDSARGRAEELPLLAAT